MRNTTRGLRGKVEKSEVADEANFDDPLDIFCGHEKSRTDFGRSGATPVDVSALETP